MEKISTVIKLLEPLAYICADKPSSEKVFAVAEVLSEYPIEKLQAAIHHFKKKAKFFPAPVDIISLIEVEPIAEAELAWNLILTQIRRKGYYGGVPADLNASGQRALENIGGWENLCSTSSDKLTFYAKQFRDAYKAFKSTAEHHTALSSGESKELLETLENRLGKKAIPE